MLPGPIDAAENRADGSSLKVLHMENARRGDGRAGAPLAISRPPDAQPPADPLLNQSKTIGSRRRGPQGEPRRGANDPPSAP